MLATIRGSEQLAMSGPGGPPWRADRVRAFLRGGRCRVRRPAGKLGGQFGEMHTMMQHLFQSMPFCGEAAARSPTRTCFQGVGA